MAGYGWGKNSSVEEGLFSEGHSFDFFQAVRLLEMLAPHRQSVGVQENPDLEVVRFRSRVRLDFPATDVDSLEPAPRADAPARMSVNLLGVAGALGPLPSTYSELLLERLGKKDTAFRDFLDIFNHRLISLLYRARRKFRAALQDRPPDESLFARSLLALIGLGTPGLSQRLGVPDRALLKASGILAHQARPVLGLERLVEEHFQVPARVEPFRGDWFPLEPDCRTAIGHRGFNRGLGQGAILGRRVWVQDAGYVLELGPLDLADYLAFLPVGRAFRPARELARFYTGDDLGCTLRLRLKASHVPPMTLGRAGDSRLGWSALLRGDNESRLRLGKAGGSRLGWTSWLGRGAHRHEATLELKTERFRPGVPLWRLAA